MSETVERSWGRYTVLHEGQEFKVKQLDFDPGKPLSLQKHFMREELWLFTKGQGVMTNTSERTHAWKSPFNVAAGMFIWIGKEKWHSFVATEPTTVIEVQLGICKEDDIMRTEQPERLKEVLLDLTI